MRHLVGAVALFCSILGACASERPDAEGDASESQAATAHDVSGIGRHAQPANQDAKTHVTAGSETTRPQTDPWSPTPVDSADLRERPQTDPWRPVPNGTDPTR